MVNLVIPVSGKGLHYIIHSSLALGCVVLNWHCSNFQGFFWGYTTMKTRNKKTLLSIMGPTAKPQGYNEGYVGLSFLPIWSNCFYHFAMDFLETVYMMEMERSARVVTPSMRWAPSQV